MKGEQLQGFHLSPQQRQSWQLAHGGGAVQLDHAQCVIALAGAIDGAALRTATQTLVDRHDILRTGFQRPRGLSVPLQMVQAAGTPSWCEVDLSGLAPACRQLEGAAIAAAVRCAPFDLSRPPLLRVTQVHLSARRGVIVLTLPCLCADGATLANLATELASAYGSVGAGRRWSGSSGDVPGASAEVVQYLQFSEWQRGLLEQEGGAGESERQRALEPLRLPLKGRRPSGGIAVTPRVSTGVEAVASHRVAAVARKLEVSPQALLLAGWQALLWRLTGLASFEIDVVCGCRGYAELDGVCGPLAKVLPVACRIEARMAFAELALQAERDLLKAAARAESFDPGSATTAVTDGAEPGFAFELTWLPALDGPGGDRDWQMEVLEQRSWFHHFKVGLSCSLREAVAADEEVGGLVLRLDRDPRLLDGDGAGRLAEELATLLDGALDRPATRLCDLEVLGPVERRRTVVDLNRTNADTVPSESLVDCLVARRVERHPDAMAVVARAGLGTGGERLSYGELDARANRLAHHLAVCGAGPETLVAVCAERCPELLVAILGTLKAGAAFLPLDPDYPDERLHYILTDAAAAVLLTQERLRERFRGRPERVVCLDTDWPEIACRSAADPGRLPDADGLAYVIYTSGSTGRPKGVMVTHRGLANYLVWCTEAYAIAEGSGAPLHTSIGFDLTITSLLAPLVAGRAVMVLPGGPGGDALVATVGREHGFSLVKLTPSHLQLLAAVRAADLAEWTRCLVVGGEALLAEQLAPWRVHASGTRIINEYGPTETVVGCCAYELPLDAAAVGAVPIGRPIANTRLYLLDQEGRPVPVGVAGELMVGGHGVGRGYLGRQELTAERFVPDALSGLPGARLYRTGDLVRLLADGNLEFVGRRDQQLKVRGFRIELGEIEAALARHPGVREAAVVARGEGGERTLVAYVVAAGDATSTAALRAFLMESLPEPMVPGSFVLAASLPLTTHGKVDRRALAEQEPPRPAAQVSRRAPATPVQEILAGIWEEVLRRDSPGLDDDFFALGGHSLLAARVVVRVREALAVDLEVGDLLEHTTLKGLAVRIEVLQRQGLPGAAPALTPAPRGGPLLLSWGQEQLWFIDQLAPGTSLYNVCSALRLEGRLDAEVLGRCLDEVERRHEILRTTFDGHSTSPVQVISPAKGVRLPVIDLRALGRPLARATALSLAAADARCPFDLARGPLWRCALLRLPEDEHVALLALHHIVTDAWSQGVLVHEIVTLYHSFAAGAPSPLPSLPVQYADFASWQRRWLVGEALAARLAYWRERLAGAPADAGLATDRPRPAIESTRGGAVELAIGEEDLAGLERLGRSERATRFMTLLAGLTALLFRYTGRCDIAVGAPFANRERRELEPLIGFFANVLALRTTLDPDSSCRQLLQQVRCQSLQDYAHQDLPFEKLVAELRPERALARTPLFQVVLVGATAGPAEIGLPGLRVEPLPPASVAAKFDLSLIAADGPGLRLVAEYSAELFDATTIRRLLGHLAALLSAMAAGPDLRLDAVPLLGPAERQQLLIEWGDTAAGIVDEESFHRLFERQAELRPWGAALRSRGERLSYRELDERANRLAHYLRRLGIGPDVVAAFCLERSPDLAVTVLAILKAGGAYLPLDPEYPRQRLAAMLADSGAALVVTTTELAGLLPAHPGATLALDAAAEEIARESRRPPLVRVEPDNAAYVIFTSGSTGRPKGAVICHRGLSNLAVAQSDIFGADAGSRVLQFASWSFDASIFEAAMAWGVGAELVLEPRSVLAPGRGLCQLLAEYAITHVTLPPSALNVLPAMDLPELATIVVAGEACAADLVDRWAVGRRFFNAYGPTETAVWATTARGSPGRRQPPIGRPIANIQARVLDAAGELVPIGVAGELYLGGAALARGYLRRPELSAERFLPDPWGGSGERLYRTGDLVRRLPNGEIEFMGRVDQQVKVRGIRVELGEIELALRRQPGVREAVAAVREELPGQPLLLAYVVAEGELPPEAELRAALRSELPEHMVPAIYLVLPALPLTVTGKVDRRALSDIALPSREARVPQAAELPADPVVELTAAIWAEVLALPRVALDDDFFALGGHSLLATGVVSRVRELLGVELPVRSLFECPTVASLGREIARRRLGGERPAVPPLVRCARSGDLPLSFAQQRLWFLDRLGSGAAYHIPAAVRLAGALSPPLLAAAFSEVVRRHEALRTRFELGASGPVQRIDDPAPFDLPLVDLEGLPVAVRETELAGLAAREPRRSFDLCRGPLLRATLVRLGTGDSAILATAHHIIADAWSAGILLRELGALYGAFAARLPSPLTELSLQYPDYAVWQREWLQDDALDRRLEYWRRRLAGLPPLLDLPTDHPRLLLAGRSSARRPLALPPEIGAALSGLARRYGATLFMLLLAAWQTLLKRYSGQDTIPIGTPIAGRNHLGTEALIGCFVNTLVLRSDLPGDLVFLELLDQVRQTCLEAHEHEVPFEKLVEELQPDRNLLYPPLVQAVLSYQNAPAPAALAGLAARPIESQTGSAKFDLTLTLRGGETIDGALEYRTDLFESSTAARHLYHLEALLEGLAVAPDRRLSDLPLLSAAERLHLLVEWSASAAAAPPASTSGLLHERVTAQAERTPDAIAIVGTGAVLSYSELERRAERLACTLRAAGVGPEALVGMAGGRSLALVVGLLALLKAGGAYVPLDPTLPQRRLEALLGAIQPQIVLATDADAAAALSPLTTVLRLDGAPVEPTSSAPRLLPPPPLARDARPETLAYVLHTSGSTGAPKGVMITHAAICHHLDWGHEAFPLWADDRVLQSAGLSFDFSLWEIFAPLWVGAVVILTRPERVGDPAYLRDLICDQQVTVAHFIPSLLAPFLDQPGIERCVSLRRVFSGGEALPPELVSRSMAKLNADLWNQYGPTEATIDITFWRCRPEDARRTVVPIGRAGGDVRVYVLDRDLQPQPIGATGDLYIGGTGLARGYLRRPELTAAVFVPDLSGAAPGGRLYRTGDRARWRSDGALEFLGRSDAQLKVRGIRVEPGEIEAVLAEHPAVRQGIVLADVVAGGASTRLIACIVPREGSRPAPRELREHLTERLPEALVPGLFFFLESLPANAAGKLDRESLARQAAALAAPVVAGRTTPRGALEQAVAALWRKLLGVERLGVDDNFFDLGGHSLLLVRIQSELLGALGREVSVLDLFRYPTVRSLARFLGGGASVVDGPPREPAGVSGSHGAAEEASAGTGGGVAVIGYSGRFPGSPTIDQFWENLRDGVESIVFFSPEELRASGIAPTLLDDPRFVAAQGALAGIDLFDAPFFGFTPREAELTDPQHRLFLECAWEALEGAGYDSASYPGAIGVFGGAGMSGYWMHLASVPGLAEAVGGAQAKHGNDKDFLATRVSYKLDLRGPSVTVQTACSTSLVAVHLACQSLLRGECDMALAGGVSISPWQKTGYLYLEGGVHSPDGHCRAFAAAAQGSVPGSGVGVVVLKRLADAVADRDPIRAVIRGSAINNDGALKAGYTAPSIEGQAAVITDAQAAAGVEPETIGFVEGHGTATPLGDPIEVAALTQAFCSARGRERFCALGSVKSNIGHLDAAAGVAGLIKAVLALERELIPPTLHAAEPGAHLTAPGPFFLSTRALPWPRGEAPRRAAVSSFGIGGTNAHLVLEEAPAVETVAAGESVRPEELLVLSARTPEALAVATESLAAWLRTHPMVALADVAYTLQVGRRAFAHRRAVICRDIETAIELLAKGAGERGHWDGGERPVAFLFPGQGAQRPGMGRELYESEPGYRHTVDRCSELLAPHLGLDLRRLLHASGAEVPRAAALLAETELAQPALFVVEYALARLWMEWGVEPEAMLGHSLGEYVAACLAGVLALPEALRLVALRGRLMQGLAPGVMLAVALGESELGPHLTDGLSVAAINGTTRTVVAGAPTAVERLAARLTAAAVPWQRLPGDRAFHSELVEPILERFTAALAETDLRPPVRPYISNLTGTWIADEEATNAAYWARQMRQAVRFGDGLAELLRDPARVVVEVGPGETLATLARRHPCRGQERVIAGGLGAEELDGLLCSVGRLWAAGVQVDWAAVSGGRRGRRLALPTYPFERRRFWVDRPAEQAREAPRTGVLARSEIGDWFYFPHWQPAPPLPPAAGDGAPGRWLLFADRGEVAARLHADLRAAGDLAITVHNGEHFAQLGDAIYTIHPERGEDYVRLLAELRERNAAPQTVVHLWSLTPAPRVAVRGLSAGSEPDDVQAAQSLGLYSLLHLARAWTGLAPAEPLRLEVVASGLRRVIGEEQLQPEKATLTGLCKVLPQEHPEIRCRSIDLPPLDGASDAELAAWLRAEIAAPVTEPAVAYRLGCRWVERFTPIAMPSPPAPGPRLRENGVYLITGGLGRIGLLLAEHLARAVHARLVLISRSGLPPRASWDNRLAGGNGDASLAAIRRVLALEELGAEVMVAACDVADVGALRALLEHAEARFGPLHGVIHSAGLTGPRASRAIQETGPPECEAQLRSKLYGLLTLDRCLAGRRLDFRVLMSSLSTVLGGLGFAAYSAANAFMDAFAEAGGGAPHERWMSIAWDGWDFGGEPLPARGVGAAMRALAIQGQDGIECFLRALSFAGLPRLVVSTTDLHTRIDRWLRGGDLRMKGDSAAAVALVPAHARPEIGTPYVAPRTDREEAVAGLWKELLGIDRVGVEDDFFQLGGDSLLATQLLSNLRRTLRVDLPLRRLLAVPTVAGIAAAIAATGAAPIAPSPGAALGFEEQLSALESLADDELAVPGRVEEV